ncbi:4-hydroxyphenylacetate 3-monooxygenase, oxygenase component [Terrilactibacillus sp. BCM23-1]|uniref:4-hydroxyphenylacetate 3-monooxygenase, oxygenase component n=1 Tax=Terrilactibacillus tamarindi TaxID=2599694 RepID=A0A6N8CTE6_9BACI|nr:4-hydroxyphenylacetate 3-monooxygenase, oxygenase component [Terrilactibacillus tamarindi]MTT32938.1 4-hydroxyphenylacetate 3-monooxygenase, oxygenase component [Terrilactibacillus tamarindi]
MPCVNGQQYINRIDHLKSNVWINGQKVTGNISEHSSFKGIMKSQASLYDLQCRKDMIDIMTYLSPKTNERVGMSFLQPKTRKDLEKRRKMIETWARQSAGMMGRSPDYMNTVLMSFSAASDLFSDPKGKGNFVKYYEYCRENDLSLTHTFINPQVNRSSNYMDNSNEDISARVIDKNENGIIVQGARLLATQGGITDEILVFPPGGNQVDTSLCYAFAIPSNLPGLKFLCRESFDYRHDEYDHPLSARFDEMDAVVVFDHCEVPWERVFIYGDPFSASLLYSESGFFPYQIHQVTTKNVVKTEFVLGVLQSIVDTINIGEYQHIQEKIVEVVMALETLKGFLISSETSASRDQWGFMVPDRNPLYAAMAYFPKIYPRFIEIMQLIGASGLVSIPTERDFHSINQNELNNYLQSATLKGYERVKLFRLASDLCISAFGGRQTLYERFFFGDSARLSGTVYREYDRSAYVDWVKKFLHQS